MAGEGGRALGGREGGVAGLFPRRQGADPQRLGRAGSRREVRTHILQNTHDTHGLLTTSELAQEGAGDKRESVLTASSSSDDCGGVTSGVGSGGSSRWQKW